MGATQDIASQRGCRAGAGEGRVGADSSAQGHSGDRLLQHQRRPAERCVPSPARACSFTPLCLAEAHRGCSAPARLLRGEPQVFLHLVREGGAKGGCSTTDRGKSRPLSSGPSLLLLLLLRLLLRLLLCCSARTVYLRFQSLRRRLDESLRPSGAAHSELLERRGSCDARTSTESTQGCASRQAESGAWRYGSATLGFGESACTSQSLDDVLLCQVGDQAPDEARHPVTASAWSNSCGGCPSPIPSHAIVETCIDGGGTTGQCGAPGFCRV